MDIEIGKKKKIILGSKNKILYNILRGLSAEPGYILNILHARCSLARFLEVKALETCQFIHVTLVHVTVVTSYTNSRNHFVRCCVFHIWNTPTDRDNHSSSELAGAAGMEVQGGGGGKNGVSYIPSRTYAAKAAS